METRHHRGQGRFSRLMNLFSPLSARRDEADAVCDGRIGNGRGKAGTPNQATYILYLEIVSFFAFHSLYGKEISGFVESAAREELARAARGEVGADGLAVEAVDCGRFIVLCPGARPDMEELRKTALRLRLHMKDWLRHTTMRMTRQALGVLAGYAVLPGAGDRDFEARVYEAVCEAEHRAGSLLSGEEGLHREFQEILDTGRLDVLYQPIANLGSGRIIGWEALSRGPEGGYFHSPFALFDFAEQVGGVFQLEKAYRERAVRDFGPVSEDRKIFINIHLQTLLDPDFTAGETLRVLEGTGLRPGNVVFEVTERHAIRDFPLFQSTLKHYRDQGFKVAVDDVGAGYSGLWSMAEIVPDYIKLDFSLTRDIDTHPIKRGLVKTFLSFAENFDCEVIAKGIERETELTSLIAMGVHHGEGYCLGRPANPKPELALDWPEWSGSGKSLAKSACNIPIKGLAESQPRKVSSDTPVFEVKRIIGGESTISAVVVVERNRPVGLIMSHHMDRALSSQYGMSLYYRRGVREIMDAKPLVVDEGTPVEQVARRAMGRDKGRIYDHIILTGKGEVTGIVSVQRMLDTLAAVQVEMAKGANPLTGLPGNVAIEQELERRCLGPAWFSIVYADLDNFKVYNDSYGFKKGDAVIRLVSDVLKWGVRRHGLKGDFLGHVGGDDFILITSPDLAERVCLGLTRVFGRAIRGHYSPEDRQRGHILGKDRNTGTERSYPLVALSLAIVDCEGGNCDMDSISRRSAEMKRVAKKQEGNVFVRDRRGIPSYLKDPEDPEFFGDDVGEAGSGAGDS